MVDNGFGEDAIDPNPGDEEDEANGKGDDVICTFDEDTIGHDDDIVIGMLFSLSRLRCNGTFDFTLNGLLLSGDGGIDGADSSLESSVRSICFMCARS